jgi:hypothetical protein
MLLRLLTISVGIWRQLAEIARSQTKVRSEEQAWGSICTIVSWQSDVELYLVECFPVRLSLLAPFDQDEKCTGNDAIDGSNR